MKRICTSIYTGLLLFTFSCGEVGQNQETPPSPPPIKPNLPILEDELSEELLKRKKLEQLAPLVFSDVAPIIKSSCASNGLCHGADALVSSRIFVDQEQNLLRANDGNPGSRIRNNTMPRGTPFLGVDRSLLLRFLDERRL